MLRPCSPHLVLELQPQKQTFDSIWVYLSRMFARLRRDKLRGARPTVTAVLRVVHLISFSSPIYGEDTRREGGPQPNLSTAGARPAGCQYDPSIQPGNRVWLLSKEDTFHVLLL